MDGKKHAALGGLFDAAFAGAQVLGNERPQRILGDVGGPDQALSAGLDISDNDRRAARRALGVKGGENFKLQGR